MLEQLFGCDAGRLNLRKFVDKVCKCVDEGGKNRIQEKEVRFASKVDPLFDTN